jgi:hypothetical protein
VIGVDKDAQPHYPFEFHRADAMEVLRSLAAGNAPWDGAPEPAAIHASFPCQTFARVTAWRGSRENHPDLLTPGLEILSGMSVPWVVENVPEAGLRADYRLCGTQFGLKVRRHRDFQRGNWSAYDLLPSCQCYRNPDLLPFEHKGERAFADAMGCTWMSKEEGRQAIPPVFTEYVGGQLLGFLAESAAA